MSRCCSGGFLCFDDAKTETKEKMTNPCATPRRAPGSKAAHPGKLLIEEVSGGYPGQRAGKEKLPDMLPAAAESLFYREASPMSSRGASKQTSYELPLPAGVTEDDIRAGLQERMLRAIDGGTYEGQWKGAWQHGEGTFHNDDGGVYQGQWFYSMPHGSGKYMYNDGTCYSGDWHLGDQSGNGTQIRQDGTEYTGQFVGGRYHGRGILSKDGKVVYNGDFMRGEMHGKGAYTFADGRVYTGIWEGGTVFGDGSITMPGSGVVRTWSTPPGTPTSTPGNTPRGHTSKDNWRTWEVLV